MGVSYRNYYNLETLSYDIDFSAEASKDVTIVLDRTIKEVIQARLYIDEDPGAAFSQWLTYTFYNKAAMKGKDAFYRTATKIVYTELEVGTFGGSPNIKPDDHTDFSPNDLVLILDYGMANDEYARLKTVADTMIAEDNVGMHNVDDGIVRVSEFSGFSLFNAEDGTDAYLRLVFAAAQTVSMKLDLTLRV